MAISPMLMSGVVQRADDISVIKNQQDNRPSVEQQNVQTQMTKKVDEQRRQVVTSEDTNKTDTHADAREKGKNAYFFRKMTKGKKEENPPEDYVKKKTSGPCRNRQGLFVNRRRIYIERK